MAFAIRNLSVLAYANGFTLWHYKSVKSSVDEIKTGINYFGSASDMLTPGDLIMVTSQVDGATIVVVTLSDIETVIVSPLS